MEPWYKVATPRKEVREGRSFNPDEFAIATGTGGGVVPDDYRKPDQVSPAPSFRAPASASRLEGEDKATGLVARWNGRPS
jgi:hypothetical protein